MAGEESKGWSVARTEARLFNDRLSTTSSAVSAPSSCSNSYDSLHHRRSDPHWSAIMTATNLSSDGRLHLRHLKLLRHLGAGNLGRVFLCKIRDCSVDSQFTLKVVDRDTLSKKNLSHVQMEAKILSLLDHPFLPTLSARIDVSHYTCLLIDYCSNGDLHFVLRKQPGNRLPVAAVKFFAAEILVALGIVYRDLKPENTLLRETPAEATFTPWLCGIRLPPRPKSSLLVLPTLLIQIVLLCTFVWSISDLDTIPKSETTNNLSLKQS